MDQAGHKPKISRFREVALVFECNLFLPPNIEGVRDPQGGEYKNDSLFP